MILKKRGEILPFKVFSSSWENNAAEAQPYYNQFDFPKVNPDYYGRYPAIISAARRSLLYIAVLCRHYCYAYGQAIVDVKRHYLVKKNVCDSTEDKVLTNFNLVSSMK